jgi:hypothetical protein
VLVVAVVQQLACSNHKEHHLVSHCGWHSMSRAGSNRYSIAYYSIVYCTQYCYYAQYPQHSASAVAAVLISLVLQLNRSC